jgi:predicted  nucleic acid-binding Zn-ribbon protein
MEEKRAIELQMTDNLRKLETIINQKQREMEELQLRVLNTIDIDLERMKIKNKLELEYSQEIENKQSRNDQLSDELSELKRDYELLRTKDNSISRDHEKATDFIKESHKLQITGLVKEIKDLQEQLSSDIYKDKYNETRRDSEHLKGKLDLLNKELNDSNIELERVRREKNDILINNARLLENERVEKRELKAIYDKLSVRSRYLEEEGKVHGQKTDTLERKIFDLMNERQKLLEEAGLKEKQIYGLQHRLTDEENEVRVRDIEFREQTIKELNAERNKCREMVDRVKDLEGDNCRVEKRFKRLEKEGAENMRDAAKEAARFRDEAGKWKSEYQLTKEEISHVSAGNEDLKLKIYDLSEKVRVFVAKEIVETWESFVGRDEQ